MSRLSRLGLALALSLGLAVAAPVSAAGPVSQAAIAEVRAMVAAAPDPWGLAVAVTDRDRTLLVAMHGYADIAARTPVTADTRFAIGSISKSFTAITLMQLADEGRFDPDAPITRYLPDFHPRGAFPAITGDALLTHTAGLPNYLADVASMRFAIAATNALEPRYAPGAHFWYSNLGYQLLGYAAERIEGQPFALVLKRRVLDRLGMAATVPQIDDRLRGRIATSYARSPDGSYHAAPWFPYLAADGAIVSTAGDMAAYARMLLARGDAPGGRLISERAFARLATARLDDYGYGFDVLDGGRVLAHSGSIAGFQAYLHADLGQGMAVVLLGNGPIDPGLRGRIIARLSGKAPDKASGAPKPFAEPSSFAGHFIGPRGERLDIAADASGQLAATRDGATVPLVRLTRDGWGAYLTPQGPRSLIFFRDAAGAVTDVSDGATGYAKAGSGPPPPETPAAYRPLVGRYMAHGEEGPGLRIFVRNGRLTMAYADSNAPPDMLAEDGPGRFRLAEPAYAPEELVFDTSIDGRAQRLRLSGVPLYRVDLP